VAKKSIAPKPSKVKPAFKLSDARKAELQRTYDRLIDRAKGREYVSGIHDHHHILPKSLGGSNVKSNIAILTYDEHFLAHRLLTKLTTGRALVSMLYSLNRMTQSNAGNQSRIFSGWQYALARQAHVEAARITQLNRFSDPGAREAHSEILKIARNTAKARKNSSIAQLQYLSQPGALDAHRARCNTDEARERNRQSKLDYYARPGAKAAHKAACNTEKAIKNRQEASRKRYARPGEIEKFTEALREAKGRRVENVTLGLVFRSISEAQEYFGYKQKQGIGSCCRGVQKTSGGYVWRYISKEDFTSRVKCAKTDLTE
jgi:hypothetical protein